MMCGGRAFSRIRSRTPCRRILAVTTALALVLPSLSFALDLWSNEETDGRLSLDTSLKCTSLLSHAPDDRVLFPEEETGVGLVRFRMALNATFAEAVNCELAYEQRVRIASDDVRAGGGALPAETNAPYRIEQLDWEIAEAGDTFLYRHEIDRALCALHPGWGQITVGRQAVGLGRGILFGAVDVFSPFSPLEVDREWRRGIDAARIEYRVTDTVSAEVIGAFGEEWDESALLGRVRGMCGNIDGEIIWGKRARDGMYAGVVSATVGDAATHLELAVFDLPEKHPDGGLFGNDYLVGKMVLGSSYTFDVGDGLTLIAEYHHSGFGVEDIDDASARLADPDFQTRYLRGDTQILGQHAIGLQASYPLSDTWSGSLLVIQNPVDGSGMVSPSLAWDVAEDVSFTASGFVPWGEEPDNGRIESEYGAAPLSLFLQISIYH